MKRLGVFKPHKLPDDVTWLRSVTILAPDVPRSNSIGQRPFFKMRAGFRFSGQKQGKRGPYYFIPPFFISPSSSVSCMDLKKT